MGGSEFLCRVIYTHYGTGYPSQPGRKGRISGLIFSTEAWEVLPQVKPQSRGPSQACGLQREGRTLGNPQCGCRTGAPPRPAGSSGRGAL